MLYLSLFKNCTSRMIEVSRVIIYDHLFCCRRPSLHKRDVGSFVAYVATTSSTKLFKAH